MLSGHEMPNFGLGTYQLTDAALIADAITEQGYRMLDCASRYQNEHIVGQAITNVISGNKIYREDLFIISKVWWDDVEDVEAACRKSLEKLGVDYLDLYLVHWPVAQRVIPASTLGGEVTYERIKLPMYKIWA